ncbi:hypothetical protein [Aeromonas caviae]|nr:hypothetical protein [Aeromonas caviae]
MLDTFSAEFGVSTEQVQAYLGRRADAMLPAQYVQMRKIYASLRDGMSKPGDWFKSKEEEVQPEKSRALDAMRGHSSTPVTHGSEQAAEPGTEPEASTQADHANAYADHCAAIEGASDTAEWQQAYAAAWAWANETGDQNIIAGIKQIAGERKKQLSAQQ